MKALVAFSSRYGAAEACALHIQDGLSCECEIVNLKENRNPNTEQYEIVIIGGSIYGGRLSKRVVRFCDGNRELLSRKIVGLYICCLYDGEKADEQLAVNFPPWILAHAKKSSWFGGKIYFSKLKALDKFLYQKMTGLSEDMDKIRMDKIEEFCANINVPLVS